MTTSNCPRCQKPVDLCVCDLIRPLATAKHILILQHPQEPDKDLGSARLAHLMLPNSTLKVGLSWPNLKVALGREAKPANWGVLHLGSGIKAPTANTTATGPQKPGLHFVTKSGAPAPTAELEGLIILDGTWSQAKTIWWRNAWLLKLKRVILVPSEKSLYRELRREPRKECLSTIEAIAESLQFLGEKSEIASELKSVFARLLEKQRTRLRAGKKHVTKTS